MRGGKPASVSCQPVDIVELLAKRPDLRGLFPLADEVDAWVRWSA